MEILLIANSDHVSLLFLFKFHVFWYSNFVVDVALDYTEGPVPVPLENPPMLPKQNDIPNYRPNDDSSNDSDVEYNRLVHNILDHRPPKKRRAEEAPTRGGHEVDLGGAAKIMKVSSSADQAFGMLLHVLEH